MSIYRKGWVPVLYRFELEEKLKEQGFENWRQISRFLCNGDVTSWDDDFNGPEQYVYQVVDNSEWRQRRDAKFWQRLNRLWFIPLWVSTMPFQWLIRGRVGFENESKLAKIIIKLTGLS